MQPAKPSSRGPISFRQPVRGDGEAIWNLVADCAPLDRNSMYCNLLQCDHFADTCVVAEQDGQIVGWISGYIVPDDPETLFVWQVAVSAAARGQGLGRRMLRHIVNREVCAEVSRMQTTITRDNDASWGLFRAFANSIGGHLSDELHFCRERHFGGAHDSEHMVTITLDNAVTAKAA